MELDCAVECKVGVDVESNCGIGPIYARLKLYEHRVVLFKIDGNDCRKCRCERPGGCATLNGTINTGYDRKMSLISAFTALFVEYTLQIVAFRGITCKFTRGLVTIRLFKLL